VNESFVSGPGLAWSHRISRKRRAAWKELHDLLLSYGGPPLPLVRQSLLAGTEAASQPAL
jgi:hypothetical protein